MMVALFPKLRVYIYSLREQNEMWENYKPIGVLLERWRIWLYYYLLLSNAYQTLSNLKQHLLSQSLCFVNWGICLDASGSECLNNTVFKFWPGLQSSQGSTVNPWYIFPGPYSHISWQVTDPYCLLAKNISSLSCGSLQLTTCSLISHRASEPESKRWKPKRKKKNTTLFL